MKAGTDTAQVRGEQGGAQHTQGIRGCQGGGQRTFPGHSPAHLLLVLGDAGLGGLDVLSSALGLGEQGMWGVR